MAATTALTSPLAQASNNDIPLLQFDSNGVIQIYNRKMFLKKGETQKAKK